jgi:eukaryotic-like serine/threonine-protein kinase
MPLESGTRLGSYEIETLIGTGGMGEVYRAKDTRLNRHVAIKVLPDLFAGDPDTLARFTREAQLLASLNHSHIAQVYGLEHGAIVMELVEGPTLAERIARGAMPAVDVLSIARQISQALEAAHERGIVHRDLKPANIKLTVDGHVKVLDFGLAKALSSSAAAEGIAASMNSPAYGTAATAPGIILGTAAYMSPEQARGQPVDKRTDIWAFGVVLYEMLSGRRPFDGQTLSDTVAAVLRQEIDWTRLPADTPEDLRRLLRRCLERDPANRLHDAADARLVIADLQREQDAPWRTRRASRALASWLPAAALATAAAIVGGLLGMSVFRGAPRPASLAPIVRFAIEPPPEVTGVSNVTLASDGRFVVYEGQVDGESRLFLRPSDALESRPLAGTEGARWPFISPDGAWIGFFRDAKLYKIATRGGDALALCDVRGGPGATWDNRGHIIFARTWLSGLSIVSADGGTPASLTVPDRDKHEIGHWWPSLLPDGRILFTIVTAGIGLNDAKIGLLDPATGKYRVVIPGARAVWTRSGHLVFFRTGRYQAVPFDPATGEVSGDASPVLGDAQEIDPAGDWPQPVAVAPAGDLAYLAGAYVPQSRLTWIDAAGTLTPLEFAPRPFVGVKLSPDGRRVATASLEGGRLLIRVLDLERATEETPTIDGMNWNPTWLPDGRLSYTSMRKGDFDVYVKNIGGNGAETPILVGTDDTDPVAWTHDGRLVVQGSEPDGAYPLKLFNPATPTELIRLTEQHVENGGSLSPDDRWLAYHSAASGRPLVYVRALDGPLQAFPLSRSNGEFPVFLRDGKTLAFVRGRQLVVLPWHERDGRFETGPERAITEFAFGSGWTYGAPYDTAPDGRFLALVRTDASPPLRIRVVLGWDRELARLGVQDAR